MGAGGLKRPRGGDLSTESGPTEAVSSSASHPVIKWQGGEEIFICRFFGCLSCIKKYIYDTTFEAVN